MLFKCKKMQQDHAYCNLVSGLEAGVASCMLLSLVFLATRMGKRSLSPLLRTVRNIGSLLGTLSLCRPPPQRKFFAHGSCELAISSASYGVCHSMLHSGFTGIARCLDAEVGI